MKLIQNEINRIKGMGFLRVFTRIETEGEASWRGRDRGRGVENYFSEVEDEPRNFSLFLGLFEDETRGIGISGFFSAILRMRLLILVFQDQGQDEARNFAPFLGHFEVETRRSRTSAIYICEMILVRQYDTFQVK